MSVASVGVAPVEHLLPKLGLEPEVEDDYMETSSKILNIIYRYRLTKALDVHAKQSEGTPKFLAIIHNFVQVGKTVRMCLPAFPFKSANKTFKVLGSLPDKAEEISLDHLNTLCATIGDVYKPGAKLLIISDGLVYNDLLTIPDREVWAYGQELRAMASKRFQNIQFSRLRDLISFPLPYELEEITYVANATNFRRALLNMFGKHDLDIDQEIAENEDTRMTYRGYRRFLESDLRYIYPLSMSRSNTKYKKDVKFLAKEMIARGYAFARSIKENFPDYLRLSIHQSTGEHKISISLLPTRTSYTTPWHCCVAFTAGGDLISGPKGEFEDDPRFELVLDDGKPSFFREKSILSV